MVIDVYSDMVSSVWRPVPLYTRNWFPIDTDQLQIMSGKPKYQFRISGTGLLSLQTSSAVCSELGSSVYRRVRGHIQNWFPQFKGAISSMTMERPVMRYILTDRMNVWSEWIHRSPAQVIKATFYHCFRLKILYASISCVQKGTTNRLHF